MSRCDDADHTYIDGMRIMLRQMMSLILLVVILATSVQLAAARGQAPAVGTIVICAGSGPVHVLVDENGQPTGGVMICPDYAVAFYADPHPLVFETLRMDRWQDLWSRHNEVRQTAQTKPLSQPRGPPVSI